MGWFWYLGNSDSRNRVGAGRQTSAGRPLYLSALYRHCHYAGLGHSAFVSARRYAQKDFISGRNSLPGNYGVFNVAAMRLLEKQYTLFNHALQVTKNNYPAHNARGITYGELGQYQLAIKDFSKAISLKQDYADAYYNRGYAYTNLGQFQRAIEDYNEFIRLKPDNEEAHRLLKFALEMEQQQKRVN